MDDRDREIEEFMSYMLTHPEEDPLNALQDRSAAKQARRSASTGSMQEQIEREERIPYSARNNTHGLKWKDLKPFAKFSLIALIVITLIIIVVALIER